MWRERGSPEDTGDGRRDSTTTTATTATTTNATTTTTRSAPSYECRSTSSSSSSSSSSHSPLLPQQQSLFSSPSPRPPLQAQPPVPSVQTTPRSSSTSSSTPASPLLPTESPPSAVSPPQVFSGVRLAAASATPTASPNSPPPSGLQRGGGGSVATTKGGSGAAGSSSPSEEGFSAAIAQLDRLIDSLTQTTAAGSGIDGGSHARHRCVRHHHQNRRRRRVEPESAQAPTETLSHSGLEAPSSSARPPAPQSSPLTSSESSRSDSDADSNDSSLDSDEEQFHRGLRKERVSSTVPLDESRADSVNRGSAGDAPPTVLMINKDGGAKDLHHHHQHQHQHHQQQQPPHQNAKVSDVATFSPSSSNHVPEATLSSDVPTEVRQKRQEQGRTLEGRRDTVRRLALLRCQRAYLIALFHRIPAERAQSMAWPEILPLITQGWLTLKEIARLRQTCKRLYQGRHYKLTSFDLSNCLTTTTDDELLRIVLPTYRRELYPESFERLNFSKCCLLSDNFTKGFFANFPGVVKKLKSLSLDYCYVLTDASLEVMLETRMPNLESLSLKCVRSRDMSGEPFSVPNKLSKTRWPMFHKFSCVCTAVALSNAEAIGAFIVERAAELGVKPAFSISGSLASTQLLKRLGCLDLHRNLTAAVVTGSLPLVESIFEDLERTVTERLQSPEFSKGRVLHRLLIHKSASLITNAPCVIDVADDGTGNEKAVWILNRRNIAAVQQQQQQHAAPTEEAGAGPVGTALLGEKPSLTSQGSTAASTIGGPLSSSYQASQLPLPTALRRTTSVASYSIPKRTAAVHVTRENGTAQDPAVPIMFTDEHEDGDTAREPAPSPFPGPDVASLKRVASKSLPLDHSEASTPPPLPASPPRCACCTDGEAGNIMVSGAVPGVVPGPVYEVKYSKWTYAFHIAIRMGNEELVEFFLKKGAVPDAWGFNFASPLYLACCFRPDLLDSPGSVLSRTEGSSSKLELESPEAEAHTPVPNAAHDGNSRAGERQLRGYADGILRVGSSADGDGGGDGGGGGQKEQQELMMSKDNNINNNNNNNNNANNNSNNNSNNQNKGNTHSNSRNYKKDNKGGESAESRRWREKALGCYDGYGAGNAADESAEDRRTPSVRPREKLGSHPQSNKEHDNKGAESGKGGSVGTVHTTPGPPDSSEMVEEPGSGGFGAGQMSKGCSCACHQLKRNGSRGTGEVLGLITTTAPSVSNSTANNNNSSSGTPADPSPGPAAELLPRAWDYMRRPDVMMRIVSLLLNHPSVSVDAEDAYSIKSPVVAAIKHDNVHLLKLLIKKGARLNVRAPPGDIPAEVVMARRQHQQKKVAKGHKLKLDYKSPLFIACEQKALKCVHALLEAGADPNWRDPFGTRNLTPTFLVHRQWPDDLELLGLFIKHGAGATDKTRWVLSDVLANSILGNDAKCAEFLIAQCPDLVFRKSQSMWQSPLIQAARLNRANIGQILLARGCDPNVLTDDGCAAVHITAAADYAGFLDVLHKGGANLDLKTATHWRTPLHAAVSENAINALRYLTSAGADVNAKDATGLTPLMAGILARNEALVLEFLRLAKPALNLDLADNLKRTALMYAVFFGQMKVAMAVFELGASCLPEDRNGHSVLVYLKRKVQTLNVATQSAGGTTGNKINKWVRQIIVGGSGAQTTKDKGLSGFSSNAMSSDRTPPAAAAEGFPGAGGDMGDGDARGADSGHEIDDSEETRTLNMEKKKLAKDLYKKAKARHKKEMKGRRKSDKDMAKDRERGSGVFSSMAAAAAAAPGPTRPSPPGTASGGGGTARKSSQSLVISSGTVVLSGEPASITRAGSTGLPTKDVSESVEPSSILTGVVSSLVSAPPPAEVTASIKTKVSPPLGTSAPPGVPSLAGSGVLGGATVPRAGPKVSLHPPPPQPSVSQTVPRESLNSLSFSAAAASCSSTGSLFKEIKDLKEDVKVADRVTDGPDGRSGTEKASADSPTASLRSMSKRGKDDGDDVLLLCPIQDVPCIPRVLARRPPDPTPFTATAESGSVSDTSSSDFDGTGAFRPVIFDQAPIVVKRVTSRTSSLMATGGALRTYPSKVARIVPEARLRSTAREGPTATTSQHQQSPIARSLRSDHYSTIEGLATGRVDLEVSGDILDLARRRRVVRRRPGRPGGDSSTTYRKVKHEYDDMRARLRSKTQVDGPAEYSEAAARVEYESQIYLLEQPNNEMFISTSEDSSESDAEEGGSLANNPSKTA